MSDEEIKSVERFVLAVVESHATVRPADLIELGDKQDLSPSVVNQAMWQLVGEGELGFTDDWKLTR